MEAVKAFHRMFADEDYMCIWHKNLSLQQIFQSIHVAELHIVLMLVNTLEDEPILFQQRVLAFLLRADTRNIELLVM